MAKIRKNQIVYELEKYYNWDKTKFIKKEDSNKIDENLSEYKFTIKKL